jgi:hypothetical protein
MAARPSGDYDVFGDDYEGQAGGEDVPRAVKYRAADFPKHDLMNPSQFRLSVRHVLNVHDFGTPEEHEEGRIWYPKVHEAAAKGARLLRISPLHAAGEIAAVSPSMDWERNNIDAFHEIGKLRQKDWDVLVHSATATPAGPMHKRTPEASALLKGMSLSTATDSGLLKAYRIRRGEHPDDVMPPQSNPKTNSFTHAIDDPEADTITTREGRVRPALATIDKRAHDIAQNEQWPWEYTGRGISSADLPASRKLKKNGEPAAYFGKPSRYEQFSNGYSEAGNALGVHRNVVQARTWITGKRIERSAPTVSGNPRVQGVPRKRQPYV